MTEPIDFEGLVGMIESLELIENITKKTTRNRTFSEKVNEIEGFPKKVNIHVELID